MDGMMVFLLYLQLYQVKIFIKKRNSVEECLEFINKDLDDVISITDDEICPFLWDEGNRSRMSRSSALALKMDLNLQFKRYDVAKEAAKID